ncbi:hypothetical protein Z043_124222, partial [Scleropages formosus]
FQRTPSLRRKWRKRYGGLDGNKLLEPNKEEDIKGISTCMAVKLKQQWAWQHSKSSPGWTVANVFFNRKTNSPEIQVQAPSCLEPMHTHTAAAGILCIDRTAILTHGRAADVLFESFASQGRINASQFFETVWSSGIQKTDPRIKDCYLLMRKLQETDGTVDRDTFHRCVTGFVSFILKALQGRFVIPDFSTFTEETQKLFMKSKQLSSVKQEPGNEEREKWGVSICTVDGQRLSLGDCVEPCVLGEISWPLIYGIAVDQLGTDYVHRYVGVEEFSKYDSPFTLTKHGTPHSPLIMTGAIITTSLLQLACRLGTEDEEKYESVLNSFRRLCNKEHANLNCTSYQIMKKDSIALHALSFYLQEKKCFPESVDINTAVDLIQQCSSTEVTCESGAVMAATLANGGLCPLSGDKVLCPPSTRAMLSVMQVAGMNEYSRMFHFKTSVPAKSSKSGALLIVVPGILGMMCWSPALDSFGNSWKSVHFCEELVSMFQLHSFDIRTPFRQVVAYRQWKAESEGYQIMNVLLAAYRGDVQSLRRYFLSGANVNAVDYDGRSALHVAASEGHLEAIKFLVENGGAKVTTFDRFHLPIDPTEIECLRATVSSQGVRLRAHDQTLCQISETLQGLV